jgi:hypothetical protein
MPGKYWTEEERCKALNIVHACQTPEQASAAVSSALGRPLSWHAIRHQLHIGSGALASPPVAAAPPPPADPLEQRREKKSVAQLKSAHEDLLRRLEESEKRNAFLASTRGPQPLHIASPRLSSGRRSGAFVALLSDAHVEEPVDFVASGYRNSYSLEIANQRLERFFEAVVWMVKAERAKFDIRDVVLWLGGDLMTGFIHEENVETSELSPTETALWLRPRLAAGLRKVHDELDVRLTVPCNVGNHGRTTRKTHIKTLTRNSYEWLLYKILEADFANDADERDVAFDVPESAHTFVDVFDDFCLHFHHGDSVKFGGGVGGLTVPLKKKTARWDKAFIGGPSRRAHTIHHIGHYHQFLDIGDTIVNGSVIGWNEYAAWIGCDFEPPQQACYVLDSKRGKTSVSPLWVGELEQARRAS